MSFPIFLWVWISVFVACTQVWLGNFLSFDILKVTILFPFLKSLHLEFCTALFFWNFPISPLIRLKHHKLVFQSPWSFFPTSGPFVNLFLRTDFLWLSHIFLFLQLSAKYLPIPWFLNWVGTLVHYVLNATKMCVHIYHKNYFIFDIKF